MGRSERRSGLVQVAFLCFSLALLACGARLGVLYNGWAWFWAALALTVCAAGTLTGSSRARRVGAVAAIAAFASGLAQGNDQNYPLIAWEWAHWPVLAAALWVVGASYSYKRPRYYWESWCAIVIGCIYIYEYVNNDSSFRLLIELMFFAMLVLSIGGTGGKLARIYRNRRAVIHNSASGAVAVEASQEELPNC